jgi:hypothetical protein
VVDAPSAVAVATAGVVAVVLGDAAIEGVTSVSVEADGDVEKSVARAIEALAKAGVFEAK